MATDWTSIISKLKESQGKTVDIALIAPTDTERTLGLFMKKAGDFEGCLRVFRATRNFENLRAFAAAIVMYAPKEGQMVYNENKLKQLFDGVEETQLENLASETLRRNKPETPFNAFRSVAEHPKVTLKGREPGCLVYTVYGTKDVKVPLVNREEGYKRLIEILKDVNGTIKGEESYFFDWSWDAIRLAQVLVTYYGVTPSHGQLVFTKRILDFSKYIPSNFLWIPQVYQLELEKKVNAWSGIYLPVRASGTDDELALTYAWICENDIHKKNPDIMGLIEAVKNEVKHYWTPFNNPVDINGAVEDLVKQRDVSYADMKESLIKSADFMKQFSRIDKLYDDAMMRKDMFHFSESYWGSAHMIELTRRLLERIAKIGTQLDAIDIIGSAGPGVAAALNIVYKEAPYNIVYSDKTLRNVFAPGKPEQVNWWNVQGVAPNEQINQPIGGVRFTIWSEITETNETNKELAIIGLLKPDFYGVLVVGYTMMTARNFGRICDAATKNGYFFELWKHPRLDNDRIYWIFTRSVKPSLEITFDEDEVVGIRDKFIKDTEENDSAKRLLVAAGIFPTRSTMMADLNETDGFYLTLAVPAKFKVGMAKKEKTGLDQNAELLKRLKIREDKMKSTDNNNTEPPKGDNMDTEGTDKSGGKGGGKDEPELKKKKI